MDTTTYSVIRRSRDSWNPITREGEILAAGSADLGLVAALIERDARNLLLGEAEASRWAVEPAPFEDEDETAAATVEPQDVYDFLVDRLGVEPAEADRLLSCRPDPVSEPIRDRREGARAPRRSTMDLLDLTGIGSIAESAEKLMFLAKDRPARVICRNEDQAALIRRAGLRMGLQLTIEVTPREA